MATITYNYIIGQTVYHVDANEGVREAVVRAITINVSQLSSDVLYEIAFRKPSAGSLVSNEQYLYDNVDAALAAYKLTVVV